MANISNIINVALLSGGSLISRDNMNVCAVITDERGFLNSSNRYAAYKDSDSVALDFGASSKAYAHALAFFAQSPNAVQVGGSLIVGYWRSIDESVGATAAKLTGAQVSESATVAALQSVADGSMNVTLDGSLIALTNLDFRTSSSLDDISLVIDSAIAGATVSIKDQRFIVTSSTTGVLSTLTFAIDAGVGTFIGDLVGLADGTGAALYLGEAATILVSETKQDALVSLKQAVNFKGVVFIDKPTDPEVLSIAAWCKSNAVITYDVFNALANLERNVSNIVWQIKLAGDENYRMLYSKSSQRKMATAYMSRNHTVNFSGEKTTLTMHLKTLSGVIAEPYSQTEITKAQAVGLDIYTTIKDVPALLTSGANGFVDNVYNLIAFIDAIQTDAYNLLKGTATKILQTTRGVNQLVSTVEKTTRGFVRAEAFAPGEWSSPDGFGDIETLKRSVRANGFYILAGLLSDQVQSEREQRKSPIIQVAAKNAGAIHYADIIINFNK